MRKSKTRLTLRNVAQRSEPKTVLVDSADDPSSRKLGVSAGHRAGKRKRGVSVTKRQPRETTRVITYDIIGSDGNVAIFDVHTVTRTVTPEQRALAGVYHDRPLTRAEAMRRMMNGE
jgi:hypothetical protein